MSGKDGQARTIQKFQKKADKLSGKYNHSGIIVFTPHGAYVAEQSYIKGRKLKAASVLTPVDKYLKGDYELLFLEPRGPVDEAKMEQIILSHLGIPYDYWSLIHDQVIRTLNKIWVGRKKNAWKKMVCHEFVQYMWNQYSGIFPDYYKGDVSKLFHSPDFKHEPR